MATLLDVSSSASKVKVGGVEVDVYGVSGEGIASLMRRFPEIAKLMSGSIDKSALFKLGPVALAAFIAAGTGAPDDAATEKAAAKLSVGDQVNLIEEILKRTFPGGVGPFVEQLQNLGLLLRLPEVNRSAASSQGSSKNSPPKDTPVPAATPPDK